MAARPTLDPLREAAQRLNEAEIERNRLIRALRSKRETLTDLAEGEDLGADPGPWRKWLAAAEASAG